MRTLALDEHGYLKNLADWDEEVARVFAEQAGIALSQAHWIVMRYLQQFYARYQQLPGTRPVVKHLGETLGEACGSSVYLQQLFGESPLRRACLIAGLPRPTRCV